MRPLRKLAIICALTLLAFAGMQGLFFHIYSDEISQQTQKVIISAWLVTYVILFGTISLIGRAFLRADRAEKAMAVSEERLKLLIKHTPAAVAMFDRDMRYIGVSDRWLRDYQLEDRDIIGECHYDVFPEIPESKPEFMEHHQLVLKGATLSSDEDMFIRYDGRQEWLKWELHPWRYDNGEIGGLVMFTEVITPAREALEKLKESEARFDRAVRGSLNGIWDWDLETDALYFSPRFEELLGYKPGEINHTLKSWSSMLHPEDTQRVLDQLDAHFQTRVPYVTEYRLKTKSGTYLWFEARGQAEWDVDGKARRMSGCVIDISEKKHLDSLKHEFVYTVTHELRTPLTALKGAVDMLPFLLGKEIPERVQGMLDLAIQGSERMAHLIDDLLDVGKIESGKMDFDFRKVRLDSLLAYAVNMTGPYAQKHDVSFRLTGSPENARIYIDSDRFLQIMSNLLSNAAKFSPKGEEVLISAEQDQGRIRVSVSDKGEGIPEAFQARIFQKFAQGHRDKGGTGLGLSITKTLVEKMNGSIWYETSLGKGTTFHVEFPTISG